MVATTKAQDIHFSNFYTNVLNVNPALTGFFRGKYRISATVRDQYRTVSTPYQTFSLSFDGRANNFLKKGKNIGYGFLCNYDKAGDSHFNTVQISIPLSQHFRSESKKWLYSYGIIPGIYSNTIEYTYLRFPDQFDGVRYNPLIETGETPINNGQAFFNIGAGVQATFKPNDDNSYTLGFAGNNLTSPNMSFYEDKEVILKERWTLHGLARIFINANLDVIPSVKLQFQGTQHEYQFGGMFMNYTNNVSIPRISAGVWMRARDKDAVIFSLGCNYVGFDIFLNYDLNISTLKTVSHGYGAMEITLTHQIFEGRKKKKMKSVKCPSYM